MHTPTPDVEHSDNKFVAGPSHRLCAHYQRSTGRGLLSVLHPLRSGIVAMRLGHVCLVAMLGVILPFTVVMRLTSENMKKSSESVLVSADSSIDAMSVSSSPKSVGSEVGQTQSTNATQITTANSTNKNELTRRQCIQRALEAELRWPLSRKLMYRKGCNISVILDFSTWAKTTGCGKAADTKGRLIIHMAWAGRWNDVFAPDIGATLDSFVITQDLARTKLIFWFLEPPPATSETYRALVNRFNRSDFSIQFRQANIDELAKNTCVQRTPRVWKTPGNIPLQTKSDVFRLVVLHKYGGIWIDTDTILLRDVTPIWEWSGEFGGKFAMTLKYNNAFLGLRKNSSLSRHMLELICRYPKVDGKRLEYCREVGEPCHTEWWYNHGPQQWAVRHRLGLVPFPLGLFDPANDCYGRGMLSGSGAYRMKKEWSLETVMELFRGAYALHTRSYQVAKKDRPLKNNTMFATLFQHLRRQADLSARSHAVAPVGERNVAQVAKFNELTKRNRFYTPPDPTYTPNETPHLVLLSQAVSGLGEIALTVATLMSNGYAKTFALSDKTLAMTAPMSTAAWLLFQRSGFLMPATSIVVQTYCVDADSVRDVRNRPNNIPDLNHCDPSRKGQRWKVRKVSNTTIKLELHNKPELCFGLRPISDDRYCGAGSQRVTSWSGMSITSSQCLNGAIVNCSEFTAQWDLTDASRKFVNDTRLLTPTPMPLLAWGTQ